MSLRTTFEIVLATICAIFAWLFFQKTPPASNQTPTIAQAAPEVAGSQKEAITPPKVLVYAPGAKKKVDLPPSVQNDPSVAVLESSRLPESEREQTVTVVINKDTGDTSTFVKQEPLPWMAAESRKEVAVAYGLKNGGMKVLRASLDYDLLQVKAIHAGVAATVDMDGQLFAGVRAAYRW